MPRSDDNQSTGEPTTIDDDVAGALAAVLIDDTDAGKSLFPRPAKDDEASEVILDLTDNALIVQAEGSDTKGSVTRLFPEKPAEKKKIVTSERSLFAPKPAAPKRAVSEKSLFGDEQVAPVSNAPATSNLSSTAAPVGVTFVPAVGGDEPDRRRLVAGLGIGAVVLLGGIGVFFANRSGPEQIEAEVQLIPAAVVTNTAPPASDSSATTTSTVPASASTTTTTAAPTTVTTEAPVEVAPVVTATPATRRPATTRGPTTTRRPSTVAPTTAEPVTVPTVDGLEGPAWKPTTTGTPTPTTAAPTTGAPTTAAPTTAAPTTLAPTTGEP